MAKGFNLKKIFLVSIATTTPLLASPSSHIRPKLDYGFTYETSRSDWNGQKLLEVKFYQKNASKEEELVDQLFVVRYRDPENTRDLRVKKYTDAAEACARIPVITSEKSSLEYLDRQFELPFDYQAFFLIDEDLIDTRKSADEKNEPSLSSIRSEANMIYAFWTQGSFDPGSISPFLLDSTAGYVVGKKYRPGYILGFEESIPFETQQKNEAIERERLKKRIAKFEDLITSDRDIDQESLQAYREQIRIAKEKMTESHRQSDLITIKKEGLEVHCVAGNRIRPELFLKPLMEKSIAAN